MGDEDMELHPDFLSLPEMIPPIVIRWEARGEDWLHVPTILVLFNLRRSKAQSRKEFNNRKALCFERY